VCGVKIKRLSMTYSQISMYPPQLLRAFRSHDIDLILLPKNRLYRKENLGSRFRKWTHSIFTNRMVFQRRRYPYPAWPFSSGFQYERNLTRREKFFLSRNKSGLVWIRFILFERSCFI